MKKLDYLWLVLLFLAVLNLFKPDFGFVSLNGVEAIGFNLVVVLIYLGGAYFVYRIIKIKKENNIKK